MAFPALVRNEIHKEWRSRWLVFVVVFGVFLLIAAGLYAFYVYREHRWSPPPPTPWQTQLHQQITADQQQIASLQQAKAQSGGGVRIEGGGPFQRAQAKSIDAAIAADQQAIANDNYLLANDIAPVESNAAASAAVFALGGIIMFLLTRIFGWLAAEEIAGERSDRTIAILLSRPASRDQVLLAKAAASFLIGLAMIVITLLIVYGAFAFFYASSGPLNGQVGVALDGGKPLGPGNLAVISVPLFMLMCLGAGWLAIIGVQAMSLLISVLTTRWAAIGITLAILFAGPIVSAVVGGIILLIAGSGNADFLNYLFFNLLAPVSAVAPAFGNAPSSVGSGMDVFGRDLLALTGWTLAFAAAGWLLFHRRQETG